MMKAQLRQRFAWFFHSQTPHGFPVPARVSQRALMMAGLLPVTTVLSLRFAEPVFSSMNVALLLLVLVDDITAYQQYRLAMEAGRWELVAEMLEAWSNADFDPREYLVREAHLGSEPEFRDRKVDRSPQRNPPESG